MAPASLAEEVLEANKRLIQIAFPDIEDLHALNESDAIPRLAEMASQRCAAGDDDICHVMRSWLWDGIVTMLSDSGIELGGPDYEQAYTAFVRSEDGLADQQTART